MAPVDRLASGYRLGPGLAAEAAGSQGKTADASALVPGMVPRTEFVSNKLAPKLAQQLKVSSTRQGVASFHQTHRSFRSVIEPVRKGNHNSCLLGPCFACTNACSFPDIAPFVMCGGRLLLSNLILFAIDCKPYRCTLLFARKICRHPQSGLQVGAQSTVTDHGSCHPFNAILYLSC